MVQADRTNRKSSVIRPGWDAVYPQRDQPADGAAEAEVPAARSWGSKKWPAVCHLACNSGLGRQKKAQTALSWAGHRQAALLNALHDVYLQGVDIRSLILALGATVVRWGASPLAGQGKRLMSCRKRTGTSYSTNYREERREKALRLDGIIRSNYQGHHHLSSTISPPGVGGTNKEGQPMQTPTLPRLHALPAPCPSLPLLLQLTHLGQGPRGAGRPLRAASSYLRSYDKRNHPISKGQPSCQWHTKLTEGQGTRMVRGEREGQLTPPGQAKGLSLSGLLPEPPQHPSSCAQIALRHVLQGLPGGLLTAGLQPAILPL